MTFSLKKILLFSCTAIVISGCSNSPQQPLETQLPESANQSRTHVTQFATGYCQALSERRDEKNDIYAGFFKTPDPDSNVIQYAAGYCKTLLENFKTHQSGTQIIQYAAGYCQGAEGNNTEDFEKCFIQQTDLLMEKVKAQQAKEDEDTPIVLSKNGHDVMYIKRIYPGVESMTQEQIGWSKKFGTYDDVASSNAIEQASVWVGTKTIKTGNKCVEVTSSISEIPKGPGDPKMSVTEKEVPCPIK